MLVQQKKNCHFFIFWVDGLLNINNDKIFIIFHKQCGPLSKYLNSPHSHLTLLQNLITTYIEGISRNYCSTNPINISLQSSPIINYCFSTLNTTMLEYYPAPCNQPPWNSFKGTFTKVDIARNPEGHNYEHL